MISELYSYPRGDIFANSRNFNSGVWFLIVASIYTIHKRGVIPRSLHGKELGTREPVDFGIIFG